MGDKIKDHALMVRVFKPSRSTRRALARQVKQKELHESWKPVRTGNAGSERCRGAYLQKAAGDANAQAQQLAAVLGLAYSTLLAVLGQLEVKGLIVRSPRTPPHYMAIAPDVALEALAQKRRAELDQALGIIPELQAQAAKHSDKQERLVELLTSREAERLLFESLHATVREEVVTLVRLPILISQLDEAADVD